MGKWGTRAGRSLPVDVDSTSQCTSRSLQYKIDTQYDATNWMEQTLHTHNMFAMVKLTSNIEVPERLDGGTFGVFTQKAA